MKGGLFCLVHIGANECSWNDSLHKSTFMLKLAKSINKDREWGKFESTLCFLLTGYKLPTC